MQKKKTATTLGTREMATGEKKDRKSRKKLSFWIATIFQRAPAARGRTLGESLTGCDGEQGEDFVLLGTWRKPLVSFASALPSPTPRTKRH
jgi:hypothetical protein